MAAEANVPIGSAAVIGGTATLVTNLPKVGKYSIESRFLGSQNFTASTSGVVTQTVKGGK